jgi:hypothetical protein
MAALDNLTLLRKDRFVRAVAQLNGVVGSAGRRLARSG